MSPDPYETAKIHAKAVLSRPDSHELLMVVLGPLTLPHLIQDNEYVVVTVRRHRFVDSIPPTPDPYAETVTA